MIQRFVTIKGLGVFENFVCDSEVSDFDKINIIYGFNGSGKSTLSNIFRLYSNEVADEIKEEFLSKISNQASGSFAIELIQDGKLKKTPKDAKNILVFNSQFVSEHVYDGKTQKVKKFKDSAKTAEVLKNPRIKKLENEILAIQKEQEDIQIEINKLNKLSESIKEELSKEWNANISKTRMPPGLSLDKIDTADITVLAEDIEVIESALREHFRKFKISQNNTELEGVIFGLGSSISELKIETNLMADLQTSIETGTIKLIEEKIDKYKTVNVKSGSVQQWFENGKDILEHVDDNKCPLCDSEIDIKKLIEDYSSFFSNQFSILQNKLGEHSNTINKLLETIDYNKKFVELIKNTIDKYSLHESFSNITSNSSELIEVELLKEGMKSVKVYLDLKLKDSKYIPQDSEQQTIITLHEVLGAYNNAVNILNIARADLVKTLSSMTYDDGKSKKCVTALYWKKFDSIAKQNASEFISKKGKKTEEEIFGVKFYKMLRKKQSILNGELKTLEHNKKQQIADLKQESRFINDCLKQMSISSFSVNIEKDNIEVIYPRGGIKKGIDYTLSEGEKTALAFAYFVSKIKSEIIEDNKLNDYIVVIDDPISSLDENRIFSTSMLIKNTFIGLSKQLFIMSHNLVFLKFFGNILGGENRKDFYLEKGVLQNLPVSLSNYQTSYFYKIQKIHEFIDGKVDYEIAKDSLPNNIRIVLESFLSFKFAVLKQGSGGDKYLSAGLDKLIKQIDSISFKQAKKIGLICDKNSLETALWDIKKKVDPESHGTPQDITSFEYISKSELLEMARQTLDVISYIDQIHLDKVLSVK